MGVELSLSMVAWDVLGVLAVSSAGVGLFDIPFEFGVAPTDGGGTLS